MHEHTDSRRDEWNRSANNYATFASRSGLYLDTAAALVRRAGIRRGMTVVDLACGTGMVTEAILEQCAGTEVTIVATDFSTEMISVAREQITSANVTFHCEAAEHLSQVVPASVDRVLCNAAFWQFDRERVLAELVQVLKPGGKCLFTLPDWFDLVDDPDALYENHKLLWMVLEETFIREHRARALPPHISLPASAAAEGGDARRYSTEGLCVESVERIAVAATAQDYFDFLQIPVMFKRFSQSSGVPEHELREIMTVVHNQLQWIELSVPPQIWKLVVLERSYT